MSVPHRAAVVHQPAVGLAFQRGTRQVTDLLRPTLGPLPRGVAIGGVRSRAPELADEGGIIVRRLIGLAGRDDDVGAMFLRSLLWRVHERVGDGVATTSVLFQAVFDGGLTAIAAGHHPMRLRDHLHAGLALILADLDQRTLPVTSQARLLQIAAAVCPEPALAAHLGELMWVLGQHGRVELRAGQSRGLASEVIDGPYWETPLLSQTALTDRAARRIELERPLLALSNLDLTEPEDVLRPVTLARAAGAGSLVILARKAADPCLAWLAAHSRPDFPIIVVRTPGIGPPDRHAAALADLAAMTGGHVCLSEAGDAFATLTPAMLGRARRAWADAKHLGLSGGTDDPRRLTRHVRDLRRQFHAAADPSAQAEVGERLARLEGRTALLWVDGATTPTIDRRKELARRTVAALRGALAEGALPGGGAAFLAGRAPLRARLAAATSPEERAAYQLLFQALAAPARTILANSGHDDGGVLADLERVGSHLALDLATGQVVDGAATGVLDPAAVLKLAVRSAVEGAAQALTIAAFVHPRAPETSMTP